MTVLELLQYLSINVEHNPALADMKVYGAVKYKEEIFDCPIGGAALAKNVETNEIVGILIGFGIMESLFEAHAAREKMQNAQDSGTNGAATE